MLTPKNKNKNNTGLSPEERDYGLKSDVEIALNKGVENSAQLEQLTYQIPTSNGIDDTQSFQDAKNAGHTKIYVSKGTYYVNDFIIEDMELWGELGSKIVVNDTETTTEFSLITKGTSYVHDLEFEITVDSSRTALMEIRDCIKSLFERCIFTIAGEAVTQKTPLDLYTNNNGVTFRDCYINNISNGPSGGVWIREANASLVTENIFFDNCTFDKKGADETIAIWGWFGKVKNVRVVNSTVNVYESTNNAIYAVSVGLEDGEVEDIVFESTEFNIEYIENTFLRSYASTGSNCALKNCKIYIKESENADQLIRGGTGSIDNFVIEGCVIESEASGSALINGDYYVKDCTITVSNITDKIFKVLSELKGNVINIEGNLKISDGSFPVIQNDIQVNNSSAVVLFQLLSSGDVEIKGNKIKCAVLCAQGIFLNNLSATTVMMIEQNITDNFGVFVNHNGILKVNDNNFENFTSTTSVNDAYNNIIDSVFIASGL